MKERVPWYAKIAAKIILSQLPIPYDFWRSIGLFRHGAMDSPELAIRGFATAADWAGLGSRIDGLRVLELGPGDSFGTALIANAWGARETVLVDRGVFARRDLKVYRALAKLLAEQQDINLDTILVADSAEAMLEAVGARYLTQGLESFKTIASSTVDFAFSSAVLEHIRAAEFLPMMQELRRVMGPLGVSFHDIDLQDHLAYGLNNLRFTDAVWENEIIANSGFYTNRISFSEMLSMFEQAGFLTQVLYLRHFPRPPISREKLAQRFRDRSYQDLTVSGFGVLLRPI